MQCTRLLSPAAPCIASLQSQAKQRLLKTIADVTCANSIAGVNLLFEGQHSPFTTTQINAQRRIYGSLSIHHSITGSSECSFQPGAAAKRRTGDCTGGSLYLRHWFGRASRPAIWPRWLSVCSGSRHRRKEQYYLHAGSRTGWAVHRRDERSDIQDQSQRSTNHRRVRISLDAGRAG